MGGGVKEGRMEGRYLFEDVHKVPSYPGFRGLDCLVVEIHIYH